MAATEIEKLERRYAENPQGLTFAPLAEVHRKNGEVARALELLRAGLELHPNYIPASIVLGRCHWDLGDLPAAEAAFSHVLRLDDENVIALKSLADINERLERWGEAQRWLNRLISVDRSNEEARQQLARLETSKQQPVAPTSGSRTDTPPAPPPPVEAPGPVAEKFPEVKPEAAPVPAPESMAPEASLSPAPPNLDLTAELAEPKSPPLEFIDTSGPAEPSAGSEPPVSKDAVGPPEEPAPVAGLISQEFVPPKGGAYRVHPELTHDYEPPESFTPEDLEVETTEDVELHSSGASEFRVPNAAEDFMEASSDPSPARPPELELPAFPAEPEPSPDAELPLLSEPPKSAEPPVPDVIETKAEAPAEPEPFEPRLPEPEPRLGPLPKVQEPPRRSYSVRETHGQSIGAFFHRLLSARPAGSGAAAVPPHPAEETASQQSPPSDTSVSFDDFFGSAASGPASGAQQDPDPSKDDLDQFQSWLQNLKR
jgi:hypothetical protein